MFDTLSTADLQHVIEILEDKLTYLRQLKKTHVVNENWKDVDLDKLDSIIKELKEIYENKTR